MNLSPPYEEMPYTAARRLIMRALTRGGIDTEDARFETKVLLEYVSGQTDWHLFAYNFSSFQIETLLNLCQRRVDGEPLQYILGNWEFYGLTLRVGPGTLIPRQDTETLVETIVDLRADAPATRLLDLCSGTGCISAALAQNLPKVTGMAVELSPEALEILRENLEIYAPHIEVLEGDVLSEDTVEAVHDTFDVIVCNPPYLTRHDMEHLQTEVSWEPPMALYGGQDGLNFYRILPGLWKQKLNKGGILAFEVGAGQAEQVSSLLTDQGYKRPEVRDDYTGKPRVVYARK